MANWSQIWLFVGLWISGTVSANGSDPAISLIPNTNTEFFEGENALLMCVVRNIGTNTVIWSKVAGGTEKILTVGGVRATSVKRISILHNRGPSFNSSIIQSAGDVWMLSIKNIRKSDAGSYLCKVNSIPPLKTLYTVTVRSNASLNEGNGTELRSYHNYTQCCLDYKVSDSCIGFCAIHNILEGSTGVEPEKCESQFPKIVRCMADLRDHVPCCERQGIPDICQDLCRGEYTVQDDFVQTHFSCTAYTEATLLCITEGIEILPEQPKDVRVEVKDSTSLVVNWSLPAPSSPIIDNYIVNITRLKQFAPSLENGTELVPEIDQEDDFHLVAAEATMQIKAMGNATSLYVRHLTPLSWYEISLFAQNFHGKSLPTYKLRVLTPEDFVPSSNVTTPELPDIMGCCMTKGIKHQRCIYNLCNPKKRFIEEPDMIVCAAWSYEAFSCLANGVDHTPCCQARGLPEKCLELCSGEVTKMDFSYFKCVDYFSDYKSCLLKGYGVLPSTVRNVRATNVYSNFALITWDLPLENSDSIMSYHAYYKPFDKESACAKKLEKSSHGAAFKGAYITDPPFVLENLCEDTEYELYIQAFNNHGSSDPSNRLIFKTKKPIRRITNFTPYNETTCCQAMNISPACMTLCNHNPKMSDVQNLASTCKPEMSHVMKCVVGGRDHSGCCKRRGVPDKCLMQCRGAILPEEGSVDSCLPFYGNIMLCLEEGMGVLPGPATSLYASSVMSNSVWLEWYPPTDGPEVTNYQIHYQQVDKHSSFRTIYALNQTINVTETNYRVENLTENMLYNFFIVSINEWGMSLPSSILTINITQEPISTSPDTFTDHRASSSAPHSLVLDGKTATSLTIAWQPPAISEPTDRFSYDVHYAMILDNEDPLNYTLTHTTSTALKLDYLQPNSQYMFYVEALGKGGKSRPSETLLAWTDPAYPAFVETPTVHPINLVVEGGTMTVLCIAMGSPLPKVSLFISGKLIHEEVTRHMVTIVKNVTRDMTSIACYADNGYGTPMQSTINIDISHPPEILADSTVQAIRGTEVTLACRVEAWPVPSLIWWKDPTSRQPVIHGGNTTIETVELNRGVHMMKMTVKYAKDEEYYCHASNTFGSSQKKVKIETSTTVRMPLNISKCCERSNVSEACQSACDFDQIDFHLVLDKEECIADFGKILRCGSDASDHRGCCSKNGVPRRCLDWCRGKVQGKRKSCPMLWAPKIFKCFGEGLETLPGPPINVRFEPLSETTAQITWDKPIKNPEAVELYRVFWRAKGTHAALKNDTSLRSLNITDLKGGLVYEVAVKAGNHLGTSLLTPTQEFTHPTYVAKQRTGTSNGTGVAVGVVFSLIVLVSVCGMLWWVIRRKHIFGKGGTGISFENPSYNRKQSGEAVQIAETPNGSLNGSTTPTFTVGMTPHGLNGLNGLSNGNSSAPEMSNGGIWNTSASSTTPGFENDIDGKGGYTRMKS